VEQLVAETIVEQEDLGPGRELDALTSGERRQDGDDVARFHDL